MALYIIYINDKHVPTTSTCGNERKKKKEMWGGWDDYIFVYIVLSLNEKVVHITKGGGNI